MGVQCQALLSVTGFGRQFVALVCHLAGHLDALEGRPCGGVHVYTGLYSGGQGKRDHDVLHKDSITLATTMSFTTQQ